MTRTVTLKICNHGLVFLASPLPGGQDALLMASHRAPGLSIGVLSNGTEYDRIDPQLVMQLPTEFEGHVGFRVVHPVMTAGILSRIGSQLSTCELIVFTDKNELVERSALCVETQQMPPQIDFLGLTRGLHRSPARRLAVFTNVYNEGPMLQAWEAHYSKYLDLMDLYVIDDGSTDGSLGLLSRNVQVVRVPKGEFDVWGMANFCSAFQRFLLSKYQWVCHVDCDELLIARDTFGSEAFLNRLKPNRILRADEALLVVQDGQSENQFDFSLRTRVTEQRRRFGPEIRGFLKPVLADIPVTWGPGYHYCMEPSEPLDDLWLIHLKYIDFRRLCYRYLQWSAISSSELTDTYYGHVRELRELSHTQVGVEVQKELDKIWPQQPFELPDWVRQQL